MEFLLAKLTKLTYCPKQGVPGVYLVETFYCIALLITASFLKLFSLGGFRIGLCWWRWWFSSFFSSFFFITFFFFLAVSSQLSSGAPLFPLPKEGSTASIWTLQFFLVYKKFLYLYFICHLYLDDFKFPAQTSSPGLRLLFPSVNLFGASLRAQMVKRLPAMQETGV